MIRMTRFTDLTFEQALNVWNRGFQGYFVDMTFTMDRLISRFGQEGLSPEASIVAWEDGEPIGFVLNGIRSLQGKRIAWNGGTGVVPEWRGRGIGRRMMEACLDVYRDKDVDTAYLEAISENKPAIALYERVGYRIVDRVTFVSLSGQIPNDAFASVNPADYQVTYGLPHDIAGLSFYRAFSPWQSQWQSLLGGQSVMVCTPSGEAIGYALYKRGVNDRGEVTSIALYQCEVYPGVKSPDEVVGQLLREVYSPLALDCRRLTVNIRTSNESLMRVLFKAGFTTLSEQVFMSRDMKG